MNFEKSGSIAGIEALKSSPLTLGAFDKLPIEKQKHILDCAASVFAEEGYHFASISDICKKAGISNGALYKYFKNKESLFLSILDYSIKLIEVELYKKHTVDVNSFYEAMQNFLQELARFIEEHQNYLCIYTDLGSSSMNRFAVQASQMFEDTASRYTINLVEQGKKSGEIRKEIRSQVASYLVDSYITFFVYSLVSEYHSRRFDSFFSADGKEHSTDEKIAIIMESLKQSLQ